MLLTSCELLERPSKKDGFCFKVFHPFNQCIWATKVRDMICVFKKVHWKKIGKVFLWFLNKFIFCALLNCSSCNNLWLPWYDRRGHKMVVCVCVYLCVCVCVCVCVETCMSHWCYEEIRWYRLLRVDAMVCSPFPLGQLVYQGRMWSSAFNCHQYFDTGMASRKGVYTVNLFQLYLNVK